MDEVLVDFIVGMNLAMGLSADYKIKHFESFQDDYHCSRATVDNIMADPEFWRSLDWTSFGQALLEKIRSNFPEVYIATKPTSAGGSALGKMDWLAEHIPDLKDRFFITTDKWLLGQPGHYLVDDLQSNCLKFGCKGGIPYLVPRPHNNKAGIDPLKDFDEWLGTLQD